MKDFLVTHFLLINPLTGTVNDISSNEELSPSVTFNVNWPIMSEEICGGYVLHDNLTLVLFGLKGSRQYRIWNIGGSSVQLRTYENNNIDLTGGSEVASLDGVMYLHGSSGK